MRCPLFHAPNVIAISSVVREVEPKKDNMCIAVEMHSLETCKKCVLLLRVKRKHIEPGKLKSSIEVDNRKQPHSKIIRLAKFHATTPDK